MGSPKKCFIDPDYEQTDAARERVRLMEERNAQEKIAKIKSIIDREFKNELERREKQLELIQERYLQAQKALHLLRYVLVTSYYNSLEETTTADSDDPLFSGTNRVHPAIRKLGNDPEVYNLRLSDNPRKRTQTAEVPKEKVKKVVSETIVREEQIVNKEKEKEKENQGPYFIRNRKKRNHCIVVGNISKFMPSESQQDCSTHKWMVYVRGPKEQPDISDFVDRIVFYLHPSYKPNDVVELTKPPFHLARRGWGEFPLRIRIYFRYKLNKPVDLVHNLKLDQTYTGRQTLGNEMVIKLHLYEDCRDDQIEMSESSTIKGSVETLITDEHDYCFGTNQNCDVNIIDTVSDHSYCQFDSSEEKVTDYNEGDDTVDTELKYGLPPEPDEKSIEEEVVLDDLNKKPIYIIRKQKNDFQNIVTANGRSFMFKKKRKAQEPLLKKIFRKKMQEKLISPINNEGNSYKIEFPDDKFRDTSESLPFLFKRLPLVTKLADDPQYKQMYPYTISPSDFKSLSRKEKQNSELLRAKMIHGILKEDDFCDMAPDNPKIVVSYGRSHGYTAIDNFKCITSKSNIDETIIQTDQNNCRLVNKFALIDSSLDLPLTFVKQKALEVGAVLEPEEIIPEVFCNVTERMLLHMAMCLAENLIREGKSHLVKRGKFNDNSVIGTKEIYDSVQKMPKLAFLIRGETIE